MYVELTDLKGKIPEDFLTQALDDDADGVIDAWTQVQSQACDAVDALLCGRFDTPFAAPYPKVVTIAALAFAAEACYQRRGRLEEQNPFSAEAGRMRSQLSKVGEGKIPLTPEQPVATESGVALTESALSVPRPRPGGRRRLVV